MKKSGNTKKYRQEKRVAAFINPETKKAIKKYAKSQRISVSEAIGLVLESAEWI